MSDTQAKLMEFRELLHKLDIPVRQVSIEARIVLASTGFSRDLGVRWGFDYVNSGSGGDQSIGSGTVDGVVDIVNGDPISYGDAPGGLVVDLAAAPANGNATSFAIGLLSGSNNFLTLELSALEAEGRGEVISQPKVIAGNQQTAVIKSGSEIPYQQATSSGATAVSFKDATLKLEVTPQITPDNRIIMQLVINKDAIGEIVAGVPTIDVTQLQTQVIADNGQTIVLGGIFEQAVVESEAKTPFLGDLPLIGHLFKQTSRQNDKQETLIFITPRILETPLES
jgi:type IV pilus assembly protein PilQ